VDIGKDGKICETGRQLFRLLGNPRRTKLHACYTCMGSDQPKDEKRWKGVKKETTLFRPTVPGKKRGERIDLILPSLRSIEDTLDTKGLGAEP